LVVALSDHRVGAEKKDEQGSEGSHGRTGWCAVKTNTVPIVSFDRTDGSGFR